MISQKAIQEILGINENVCLSTNEMAERLCVTFYPVSKKASKDVIEFSEKLRAAFIKLRVSILPTSEAWEVVSNKKRIKRLFKFITNNLIWLLSKIFRVHNSSVYLPFGTILKLCGKKKYKKGVAIICLGEQHADTLPMQHISNFKTNSIITIIDFPKNINKETSFQEHFDVAMALFAYHMTNIVLAVDSTKWMIYNFNASHPIYDYSDGKFDEHILQTLIPKIIAPISPHSLSDFKIEKETFDIHDHVHEVVVNEMCEGALLFDKTGLYPKGKTISDLPFRHNYHRIIGKLHLDNRNGMSFGYISHQMPVMLEMVTELSDYKNKNPESFVSSDYHYDNNGDLFVLLQVLEHKIVLKVPTVWVMTLRSGSDKTHFNPDRDLIKIGLKNGAMLMQLPNGLIVDQYYKPSFDTKVILAHAVCNALMGSIYYYFDKDNAFAAGLRKKGISISHWHGYINKDRIPESVIMYGYQYPHVSCSSPQSAIYAVDGKLRFLSETKDAMSFASYVGDIHIEPHHGINITYPGLTKLADYILSNRGVTELGNKYL